jgi:hypothetical protein
MNSIDKMLEQFKDVASLQKYAEAQYKTILSLSKRVKSLEEENVELKDLLEKSTPLLQEEKQNFIAYQVEASSDEEMIAKVQLARIKEISMERELTLEEAKRVEIFTKILANKGSNTSIAIQTQKMNSDDLLKMLDNDTGILS